MVSSDPLIDVSYPHLLMAMAPLLVMAWGSWYLELDIESPLLVGTIRTFIQLSILSVILNPIFQLGVEYWWLVLGYTLFMILLAAYESSSRIKYYFKNLFWYVLGAMLINIALVAAFAFGVIIRPQPVWDPQYVIPIIGMLLGNCINGISLSLNALLTSMVENSREVELFLCFGATSYEASSLPVREALRAGAMPQLNGMAIIGIISIPGMMTGQILGGSAVGEAARYQILIMYMIALCALGTMFTQVYLALSVCFDSRAILRTDRVFKKRSRPSCIDWLWSWFKGRDKDKNALVGRIRSPSESSSSLITIDESTYLSPRGEITISTDGEASDPLDGSTRGGNEELFFVVKDLSYEFEKQDRNLNGGGHNSKSSHVRRILFQNISFSMRPGSVTFVKGPSGAGKSTVLRILAGLTHPGEGSRIDLQGISQSGYKNVPAWRRQVLYVTQVKVDIPGTPATFLEKVCSFRVWNHDVEEVNGPPCSRMRSDLREMIKSWEMNPKLLTSEWKRLSGGESQRMLVALALVTRPKVIMLDESTSALDLETKLKVEESVARHCEEFGMCAIWVSHDEDQQGRVQMTAADAITRKDSPIGFISETDLY